jgi:phosphatidylinositol alpha-1,6-mannosyltransferase
MHLIVLTPQMTGADGVSRMAREVVAALQAQLGSTVSSLDVWSLSDAAAPEGLHPATCFRPARGSRVAFASFALRSLHRANALIVVLHAHLLPVALPLVALGARVVPVLLGIEVWKPLGRLERGVLRRAWRVAAISQHTIDRFRAAHPDLADLPVRVCHPGLSETADAAQTTDRRDAPMALIVGRMSSSERYKGHDELIEIWPRVRARIPGATLVIAGGGDDRPRLETKAAATGVAGSVTFEGVVSASRLSQLYREAGVFVMPSSNEGFGLVFVEAMRSGTPCIAAKGAAEEIVDDGINGVIVEPGDRDALAAAVIELLGDSARRAALGRRAAADVRRRFSAAAFADRLYLLLGLMETATAAVAVTDPVC